MYREREVWACQQKTSRGEGRIEQRFGSFLILLFSFLDRQVRRPSPYVVGEMNSSGNTVDPTWQLSAWATESFSLEPPQPQSWIKNKIAWNPTHQWWRWFQTKTVRILMFSFCLQNDVLSLDRWKAIRHCEPEETENKRIQNKCAEHQEMEKSVIYPPTSDFLPSETCLSHS